MQIVIKKIAWLMQITMGTSAVESLNSAGNIFVGQVTFELRSHVALGRRRSVVPVSNPLCSQDLAGEKALGTSLYCSISSV